MHACTPSAQEGPSGCPALTPPMASLDAVDELDTSTSMGWVSGCSWMVNSREQELPLEGVRAGVEAAGLVPAPAPPRPAPAPAA